jgi:hypothetical protein
MTKPVTTFVIDDELSVKPLARLLRAFGYRVECLRAWMNFSRTTLPIRPRASLSICTCREGVALLACPK